MSRILLRASSLLIALALTGTLPLHAQEVVGTPQAAPATGTLTLQECIVRALKQGFDVQIQGYTLANAKDSLEISKATFDPTLSMSASRSFSQSSSTTQSFISGTPNPTSDSGTYSARVSKEFSTGGTATLGTSLNRSSSNSAYNNFNPSFSGGVALSVSQPLLKNGGRNVARAGVDRSTIGVARANLDFKAQVLNVVQNTENAYYNYCFAREQEHVRQLSLDLANQALDEAKTRKTVGVATDIDVLTAEVSVANARRQLILAQQQTKNSADSLLALIGRFELDQPIGTTPFDDYTGPVPTIDAVYARALDNQPDYLSTKAALDQSTIDVRVAKNAKNPDLSATGSLGYNGLDRSAGDVYQDIPKGQSYNWSLGLTLTVPWGFRGDSARYRQALATFNQLQTQLHQTEQNILVQVRSAVRSVETNLESVKIAALATQLSEKNYDLEKARFDAGVSTARLLQQSRDDLDTARLNELQSRVTLRQAIVSLNRLQGTSLDLYKIQLEQIR
ncbi:MAG TPA: TolC family protein [Opitutaceae bacterium]|nr:TolC family protein [Opitutaceae bacterium]